jgi:hypothetical protein
VVMGAEMGERRERFTDVLLLASKMAEEAVR